jgi:amidohydrolase
MSDAPLTPAPATPAPLTAAAIEELREVLDAGLAAELDDAISLRHELHAAPDLSGVEGPTARRVAAALGDPGAPQVAGTGRLLRIGPATGPSVAVRGELDGLPVTEQTGVAWAARAGAMHACGHDVHLAALTAFGRAARAVELPVALLAVLQPREETFPSGALDIVDAGVLQAHRACAVIGVHLQHALPSGTIGAATGPVNAASDELQIVVTGTAGHAGYPHLAVNPVPALCAAVLALQQAASRLTDPTHTVALSVGAVTAGRAANVIPETATALASLRTFDAADRTRLHEALAEIVASTSAGYGCRGELKITLGEPPLVNDPQLTTASWPWLSRAGFRVADDFRSCGADDFSYYSQCAPALMLFTGTPGTTTLHHPKFLPPDEMVGEVARAMLAGYLGALTLAG